MAILSVICHFLSILWKEVFSFLFVSCLLHRLCWLESYQMKENKLTLPSCWIWVLSFIQMYSSPLYTLLFEIIYNISYFMEPMASFVSLLEIKDHCILLSISTHRTTFMGPITVSFQNVTFPWMTTSHKGCSLRTLTRHWLHSQDPCLMSVFQTFYSTSLRE